MDEGNVRNNGSMGLERIRSDASRFRICFVCSGNICRSPMAETVFEDLVAKAGLSDRIAVMSAGTGDWHVGETADSRTIEVLRDRGFDGTRHRARQFDPDWFAMLDLVVALDHGQERVLKAWASDDADRSKVQLLLSFDKDQAGAGDVPDPYYSDTAFFDQVLTVIEHASVALFNQVVPGVPRSGQNKGTA